MPAASARAAAVEQQLAALWRRICGWGVTQALHSCWGTGSREGSRQIAAYMLSHSHCTCPDNTISDAMHIFTF